MIEESKPFVPPAFQWITGILLSIIAFFLISTFVKVDTVESNVQKLMITNGSNEEWKRSMERRVQGMENTRAMLGGGRKEIIPQTN